MLHECTVFPWLTFLFAKLNLDGKSDCPPKTRINNICRYLHDTFPTGRYKAVVHSSRAFCTSESKKFSLHRINFIIAPWLTIYLDTSIYPNVNVLEMLEMCKYSLRKKPEPSRIKHSNRPADKSIVRFFNVKPTGYIWFTLHVNTREYRLQGIYTTLMYNVNVVR